MPWLLFGALLGLYWSTRHTGFYGDGCNFVEWTQGRVVVAQHPLFMPVVHALRLLSSLVGGVDVHVLLTGVSVLAAAAAGPLLMALLGRHLPELTTAQRLLLTLLVACAPGWWFFAGATELHALHGFAVVLALWAQARFGLASFAGLAAWALVCGTHMGGLVLLPTFLLLELERRGATGRDAWRAVPRLALLLLGTAAIPYVAVWPFDFGRVRLLMGIYSLPFLQMSPLRYLAGEGPVAMGILAAFLPCALAAALRGRRTWGIALLGACLGGIAVALRVGAQEHGAYLLPCYPCLLLLLGFALRLPAVVLWPTAVLAVTLAFDPRWGGLAAALWLLTAPGGLVRPRPAVPASATALLLVLVLAQVCLGVERAVVPARDYPLERWIQELRALVGPGDRLFLYSDNMVMTRVGPHYLGAAYDPVLTNLLPLDAATILAVPAMDVEAEAHERRLQAGIESALQRGVRVLMDATFLTPPPGGRAHRFLERMAREHHGRRISAAGGEWLLLR